MLHHPLWGSTPRDLACAKDVNQYGVGAKLWLSWLDCVCGPHVFHDPSRYCSYSLVVASSSGCSPITVACQTTGSDCLGPEEATLKQDVSGRVSVHHIWVLRQHVIPSLANV